MKLFAIRTGSDAEELNRVLTTLFLHGFVFHCEKRLKTFEEFCKAFPSDKKNRWQDWNWISIGRNRDCKMVVDAYIEQPYDSEQIELEKFLELIKNGW